MPKMFKMAEDMNRMTNYLNDMRIMFGFVIFSTILGLSAFLLVRYCAKKKKRQKMCRKIRNSDNNDEMIAEDEIMTADTEQQRQRWRNFNSGRLSVNSGGRNLHKYPLTLPALDDKKENVANRSIRSLFFPSFSSLPSSFNRLSTIAEFSSSKKSRGKNFDADDLAAFVVEKIRLVPIRAGLRQLGERQLGERQSGECDDWPFIQLAPLHCP
uniref:Uncharacterized protein n=1 Tax=Romanomermis culicivorax TaxID=13658 RepID=A0A915HH43_ROMCU